MRNTIAELIMLLQGFRTPEMGNSQLHCMIIITVTLDAADIQLAANLICSSCWWWVTRTRWRGSLLNRSYRLWWDYYRWSTTLTWCTTRAGHWRTWWRHYHGRQPSSSTPCPYSSRRSVGHGENKISQIIYHIYQYMNRKTNKNPICSDIYPIKISFHI